MRIVARDPIASEGESSWHGGNASFHVVRSGSTEAELTVHYAVDGTAENGVDYEELSGVLTIPAGDRSAVITVVPIDDEEEDAA